MATMGFPINKDRPGYLGKVMVNASRRGYLYAMRWPKARGLPKLDYQRAQLAWLKAQQAEYKRSDPAYMIQSANHAKSVRMRARDWWTHIQAGRAWLIIEADGTKHYPQKFLWIMSTALDIMAAAPGALIVRTANGWYPLPSGATGSALVMGAVLPQWSDGTQVMTDEANPRTAQTLSDSMDVFSQKRGALVARNVQWWEEIAPGNLYDVLQVDETGMPHFAPYAPVPAGSYRYWRLVITALQTATINGRAAMFQIYTNNQPLFDPTIREAASIASTIYSKDWLSTFAFDNNPATSWAGNDTPSVNDPSYIGWANPTGLRPDRYEIMGRKTTDTSANNTARNWTLQASTDGHAWHIMDTQINQGPWAQGQVRSYPLAP